jgi:hypothetical protein
MRVWGMRKDVVVDVSAADRPRLEAIVASRSRDASEKARIASGAGRSASCRRALRGFCATKPAPPASRRHPKTRAWLGRHPRFVFHYTPTSCSWLNAVEGFFAKLSKRRLKRGVFRSIVDLQTAINRFPRETNDDPKPFTWAAELDKC